MKIQSYGILSIHKRGNELCTCNEVRTVRATERNRRMEGGDFLVENNDGGISCHKGGQRRIWRTSALLFLRNGGGRFEAAEDLIDRNQNFYSS